MRIKAALYNADHLEYGLVTIPFPIPQDQYNDTIKMLEALDIGDPRAKDCMVEEIEGCVPSLKCLEGHRINVDELDYLVKRLDSFSDGELAQFQGMAAKMGLSDMTDLINLTFCCQQATVITDFSDLEQIGRDHYMNLHGGCVSTEELEELDSMETALLLISENEGTVTPYGVVYDNGMQLSRIYQGRNFPEYLREKLSPDPGRHDFIAPQPGVTLAYRRDGDCPGWEATIKTFEELYDAADWAGIEYIYIYDTNGQWLYLPTGNQEAVLRSLKEDLENDTVQYSEPPDLEDLLGEDWDEEQEDGPSIEM